MQTHTQYPLAMMAADSSELTATVGVDLAPTKAGLPQFDPAVFGPQIVWLVITFGVFYFLMSRLVLPKIGDVLEDREERIADDLDQAQQLSQEAASVQDTFEGSLTEARAESMQTIAAARAEAQAQIDAEMAKLEDSLAAQAGKAEARIASETAAALEELEGVATDACHDILAKLINTDMDSAAIKAAVKAEISGRGA
ncbi:MAG: ATP F0F1 synthase subunit B [Pseudomonadota bacterium]